MATEVLTKQDLESFKTELLNELRTLISMDKLSDDVWLRSSQIRKMLHISPNTLQRLRVTGNLTFTKVGGIFYYKAGDVRRMFEAGRSA